jgi:biotin carboxylase
MCECVCRRGLGHGVCVGLLYSIFNLHPHSHTHTHTHTHQQKTGGIHEFADSQFGHLFAKGATREDARKALVLALKVPSVFLARHQSVSQSVSQSLRG